MEVHKTLGYGFKEIVYKAAIAYEAKLKAIQWEREKLFCVECKEIILPRTFVVDFYFLTR